MIEILHSFAIGIAFAVGVFSGALLCRLASNEGRREFVKQAQEDRDALCDRLGLQVEHLGAIAEATQNLAEWEARKTS